MGYRLERTASKQHLLEHALCGSLSNIYYSMRDSSNLFILWTLFYQRVQYRREALTKKQAQESLRKEEEFLSLALESGDIFAFRYSNGVFEFDHDFYKSLDMPIKPITSTQFQESIHPEAGKISSNISTCLIQDSLPVRSPAADIISTAKGIYGGNSDMRKRRMDKTPPAIMSE